jgi:hypothetical protein
MSKQYKMIFSAAIGRVIMTHADHSAAGTLIFIASPPCVCMWYTVPYLVLHSIARCGHGGPVLWLSASRMCRKLLRSSLVRCVCSLCFLVCSMGLPLFIFIGQRIGGEYMSVDMPKAVLRHGFGVGFGQPCGRVAGLLGLGGDLQ